MFNRDAAKENFNSIADFIKLNKIKAFLGTNTGIACMTILIFMIFIGIRYIHKHSDDNTANANFSAWNTTVSTDSDKTPPTYSFAQSPHQRSSASEIPIKSNAFASSDEQNLQTQITTLKQEVNLLTTQVNKLTLSSLKTPYQLLGVRFDIHSKQWVADIKSENTLYSLKAGEMFEGWHVVSVDNEGAKIE